MASSTYSSARTATCSCFVHVLVLVLSICCRHAVSHGQRRSVCGSGPYTLDQVGLDIYLLPNSSVTLQTKSAQRGSGILWFAKSEKNGLLPSLRERTNATLQIGPMRTELNLLCILYMYAYTDGGAKTGSYASNTACLHLIESDFRIFPDKGFKNGQVVHVTTGSPQRVFCFRRTPANNNTKLYTAPMNISLQRKKETIKDAFNFTTVARSRYYENDSCVWMVLLQPTDAGTYRLETYDCFPSHSTTKAVNFSLLFRQPVSNSSTEQNLLSQNDGLSTGAEDALIAAVALLSVMFVLAVIIAVRYRILWKSSQTSSKSTRYADVVFKPVKEDRISRAKNKEEKTSVQPDTKITLKAAYEPL